MSDAKPQIVALSKIDLSGWEESLNSLRHASDSEVMPFSAVSGEGLEDLLRLIARRLDELAQDTPRP